MNPEDIERLLAAVEGIDASLQEIADSVKKGKPEDVGNPKPPKPPKPDDPQAQPKPGKP